MKPLYLDSEFLLQSLKEFPLFPFLKWLPIKGFKVGKGDEKYFPFQYISNIFFMKRIDECMGKLAAKQFLYGTFFLEMNARNVFAYNNLCFSCERENKLLEE